MKITTTKTYEIELDANERDLILRGMDVAEDVMGDTNDDGDRIDFGGAREVLEAQEEFFTEAQVEALACGLASYEGTEDDAEMAFDGLAAKQLLAAIRAARG